MKQVLVTGATGFIGRHYCRALLDQGFRVVGVARSGSAGQLVEGCEPRIVESLSDRAAVRQALRGVDTVVHLAARVHVMKEADPDPAAAFWSVNVEGTRTLLEESVEAGAERFLFMSSVSAAGTGEQGLLTPGTRTEPVTSYGKSKLQAEREIAEFAAAFSGLRCVVLRPPGVYGAEMKGYLLRLFQLIGRGLPIPVPRAAAPRALVYVGNLVGAGIAALSAARPGVRSYYVCDRESLSQRDLVRAIGQALRVRTLAVPIPRLPMRLLGRIGDRVGGPLSTASVSRMYDSLEVDASPLAEDAGFEPPYSMQEGLAATAEWFRHREDDGG